MRRPLPIVILAATSGLTLLLPLAGEDESGPTDEELEAIVADYDLAIAELDLILEQIESDPASMTDIDLANLGTSGGWEIAGQAAVSLGGDSNVLLAADELDPIASAYTRAGLDAQVEYGFGNWGRVGFPGLYEGRFFEKEGLDPELFGLNELSWQLESDDWETRLSLEFLYSQSIFDATIDAVIEEESGLIRERSYDAAWSVSRRWSTTQSLTFKLLFGRSRFGGTSFDFDRASFRVEGRWLANDWLSLRPWGSATYHRYTDAAALPPNGFFGLLQNPEGFGLRRSNLWQAGLWARLQLGEDWSLSVPFWVEIERDHAGDYYDRDRYYLRTQLRWTPGPWTLSLEGSVFFIDYTARLLLPFKPKLDATQWQGKWSTRFELRRSFGRHFETFANVEFGALEASRPNEDAPSDIEYSGWIGELGVSYSF